MKVLLLSITFLFCASCFTNEATKVYSYSYVREFSYQGQGNIEIKQGSKNQLTLTASPELLDCLHISDSLGKLDIYPEDESFAGSFSKPIKGILEVKNLSKINLKGNVSVDIDKLQGDQLMINMELEGAPTLEGYLDFQRVGVIIHGNSKVALKGNVDQQIIYIKGLGVYLGQNLKSRYVNVHVKGMGQAIVNPIEELVATAVEYGHIHYTGKKPQAFKTEVKGHGEVSPLSIKTKK